jgi:hypothetical protein
LQDIPSFPKLHTKQTDIHLIFAFIRVTYPSGNQGALS